MYKIKQKAIYKLEYLVKLNKGLCFKTESEIKSVNNKIEEYKDIDKDKYNHYIKLLEKKKLEFAEYKRIKEESQNELKDINLGLEDINFTKKYEEREREKQFNKEKKQLKKDLTNKNNKEISQKYYKNSYQSNRKEKFLQKDFNYHYRLFQKKSASLPTYIKRNLKHMPNNKGYIWKGVWFFGIKNQNKQDNTLCMYEICGKKTFIRNKDQNGVWTITLKKKN
tara:strand:- start:50 stop:718 length:669 start_codon:yes stop_codon:yes gene_type:complete